jgi:hypothetical protein
MHVRSDQPVRRRRGLLRDVIVAEPRSRSRTLGEGALVERLVRVVEAGLPGGEDRRPVAG